MRVQRFHFLVASSLAAFAAPAMAQDAGPPVADEEAVAASDEIIVSARRRDESVQDVPQTVNVVTSAQIDKLNLRNFTDVAAIVPGLTLAPGGSFGSSATIRGVAFNPEASANNPTVEFYINDKPVSSNFVFQSMFDVGQFEIQRGPQGTLRGRASPSGSILFTTRRPDLDEVGLVVNGTLTDIHAQKIDAALNVPVIADVLAVRIAGVVDESQGSRVFTVKQDTAPEYNPDPYRHTKALRASVRFEPTDWLSANVMYQTLNSRSRSYRQVQSLCLVTGTPCPTTQATIRPFDRLSNEDQGSAFVQQHDVLTANVEVRFAGQKLSYVGGYDKQDFNSISTSDFGDFYTSSTPRNFRDPAASTYEQVCSEQGRRAGLQPTNAEFFQCTHNVSKRYSHEIRLSSDDRIANIFDYVVGFLYDKNKTKSLNLTQETPVALAGAPGSPLGFLDLTPIQRLGGDTKEVSFFGNLTAHVTDQLELSGGIRHINYKGDPNTIIVRGGTPSVAPEIDDKTVVYTASAKYQITPDIMVYANVGSSYRPGPRVIGNFTVGVTGNGPTPREQAFMNLDAEKSTSYEIGAKTSFLGGRGRFNVSLYRQDFDNFVYRGPGVFFRNYERTAGGAITQNVGTFNFVSAVPVRVKGVEAEASFQISDRWSVGVNASYADGNIRNGTIACTDIDGDGVPDSNPVKPATPDGLNLPAGENVAICPGYSARASFAPKFSGNIQSEYGFDLGERASAFVRGLYSFTGKNTTDPANSYDDVGAYGLLNLYAGLRDPDGAWEITFFGKNILRERKVLSTTNNPLTTTVRSFTGAPYEYSNGYVPVTVTAPREFGITARIALGSR